MKESERIWGKDVMAQKFVIVPKLLLLAQARLGLDATQLNVLLHLIEHWWEAARRPYPSKQRIAKRMRVGPRTVQRAIAAMEKHGLVTRVPRTSSRHGGRTTNIYDLSGLVAKLKELAPEFKQEADAAAARRRALERPGRRAAATTD
jgi:predicted transcriptional regulator